MKHSIFLAFLIVLLISSFYFGLVPKVFASTTETYYSGAGDGHVEYSGTPATWVTVHNAVTGTGTASTTILASSYETTEGTNYNGIVRSFLPFDTSGLPDGATVTAATLNVYVEIKSDTDNDGYDYVSVVQTTQASTGSLAVEDYDQCGTTHTPQKGAADIDITDISTGAYTTFTLNSTGLAWINLTGWTMLGLREGHDIVDYQIANNKENNINIATSEYTGTSRDPYLSITYTVPIGGALSFYGNASLTFASSNSKTVSFNRQGSATLTFASTATYLSGIFLNFFGSSSLIFMSNALKALEVSRYGSSPLTFSTTYEKLITLTRCGFSTLSFVAESFRSLARTLTFTGSANLSFLSEQLRTFTFNRYGTAPLSFTVEAVTQGLGRAITFFGSAIINFTILGEANGLTVIDLISFALCFLALAFSIYSLVTGEEKALPALALIMAIMGCALSVLGLWYSLAVAALSFILSITALATRKD